MSFSNENPYESNYGSFGDAAAFAVESERATFIRRTYAHVLWAIVAFVLLEVVLFKVLSEETLKSIPGLMMGGFGWLIVLGAFMAVSWVATSWANSGASPTVQYLGLALYVIAEAIIFLPLLVIAQYFVGDKSLIPSAGLITLLMFGGLTAVVYLTKVDFSFLGTYLWVGGFAAMGLIVASIFFGGFSLGILFSTFMIVLASGYIVYHTSNILHHYRTDQYVAAALALFAAVALLFWYVLQILMSLSRD
jgi:FtsH-binding integral membrane protein